MSARFNRTVSSSLSFPMRLPNRAFGTVVILSIISREALFNPLRSVGSMSMRSNGASVGSVVNAHSVIEPVWSNRSSCTMTASRYPIAICAFSRRYIRTEGSDVHRR